MVDTQVRPSDVTKFPIIDAMLSIKREDFVPIALREAAYLGENLDLDRNRTLLEPRTLAKMLDAINLSPQDLVLDIGSGFGYSSAVMARIAEAVVALEDDERRSVDAQETLSAAGIHNVIPHTAPLNEGAPEHGPYDAIVLQGAIEQMPKALEDQLKDGGRMAALFVEGAVGEVRIGYKLGEKMTWRRAFNAGAPVIEGFEKTAAFQF